MFQPSFQVCKKTKYKCEMSRRAAGLHLFRHVGSEDVSSLDSKPQKNNDSGRTGQMSSEAANLQNKENISVSKLLEDQKLSVAGRPGPWCKPRTPNQINDSADFWRHFSSRNIFQKCNIPADNCKFWMLRNSDHSKSPCFYTVQTLGSSKDSGIIRFWAISTIWIPQNI